MRALLCLALMGCVDGAASRELQGSGDEPFYLCVSEREPCRGIAKAKCYRRLECGQLSSGGLDACITARTSECCAGSCSFDLELVDLHELDACASRIWDNLSCSEIGANVEPAECEAARWLLEPAPSAICYAD